MSELERELEPGYKEGLLYHLSMECLFGVDANPRMARVAKMNMVMHGDGYRGVYHHDGLLDIETIFENRFDVILTNPPFGARVSRDVTVNASDIPLDYRDTRPYVLKPGEEYRAVLERMRNHVGKPITDLFDLGKLTTLTEVLFLERCLRLLKPGGRMGIVLPEGVLSADNLQKVREYVEDRARLLLIVSLPREVFRSSGASIKPSVVFLRKFKKEEARHYNNVVHTVTGEVMKKYSSERKGADKKHLAALDALIHDEIRREVKSRCNYKILIAEVAKAGISSTGAPDENQLPGLVEEFEKYRRDNPLWEESAHERLIQDKGEGVLIYDFRERPADDDTENRNLARRRF